MNATRILPDLQCSLLCEDVRPKANGNFIIVGVIALVRVPQVPVTALKLCVFNRWTAGVGQFTENVRLIAPDQTTVLRKGQVKFVLPDATHHATNVTVFAQVEFSVAGVYYVEVLVDDVMKIRFQLLTGFIWQTVSGAAPGGPAGGSECQLPLDFSLVSHAAEGLRAPAGKGDDPWRSPGLVQSFANLAGRGKVSVDSR